MTQEITMGSLFSGSGGFELAGSIFGIRPIWASEIEPFPILVTTKNFPEMKHLGDINKLIKRRRLRASDHHRRRLSMPGHEHSRKA